PSSRPDLFLFSSRRRHTRFSRDWSSDVCSSDLTSPSATSTPPASAPPDTTPTTPTSPPRTSKPERWTKETAMTDMPAIATDLPAPDIVRCAYMELVVTDLAASREFYVDILGLVVTHEDEDAIYLRSLEEFIHHNLVLRKGPEPAVAAFGFRVRSPEELDKAEA